MAKETPLKIDKTTLIKINFYNKWNDKKGKQKLSSNNRELQLDSGSLHAKEESS